MVTVTGLLLFPLIPFFISLIVLIYALREEIEKNNQKDSPQDVPKDIRKNVPKDVKRKRLRKILRLVFGKIVLPTWQKLMLGIFAGILIYSALIYGTSLYDSKTEIEVVTKIPALLDGAVLYVVLVAMVGMLALITAFTKRDTSFLAGVTISFSIFEVYFALRCTETIPFMENLIKHSC